MIVELQGDKIAVKADSVRETPEGLEIRFESIPDGFYSRLVIDGNGVNGFRFGFHSGRAELIIAWRPSVLVQRYTK
jgi:hypothetical protein